MRQETAIVPKLCVKYFEKYLKIQNSIQWLLHTYTILHFGILHHSKNLKKEISVKFVCHFSSQISFTDELQSIYMLRNLFIIFVHFNHIWLMLWFLLFLTLYVLSVAPYLRKLLGTYLIWIYGLPLRCVSMILISFVS